MRIVESAFYNLVVSKADEVTQSRVGQQQISCSHCRVQWKMSSYEGWVPRDDNPNIPPGVLGVLWPGKIFLE